MIFLWVCDFFAALVLRSCGCVPVVSLDVFLCLWCACFLVCICVMNCGGGPCYGLICGAYIICGFGFGLVGWPNPAVCVPLI